jgi:hypothetical protein
MIPGRQSRLSASRSWSWPASRHSSSAAMSSRLPRCSGETLAVGRQGTATRCSLSHGVLSEIPASQPSNNCTNQGRLLERNWMAKPRGCHAPVGRFAPPTGTASNASQAGDSVVAPSRSSPDLQRVSTAEMRLSGTGCVVSSIRPLATAAASWAGPPPTASGQSRPWQPTGRQPTGMLRWLRRDRDQPSPIPVGWWCDHPATQPGPMIGSGSGVSIRLAGSRWTSARCEAAFSRDRCARFLGPEPAV